MAKTSTKKATVKTAKPKKSAVKRKSVPQKIQDLAKKAVAKKKAAAKKTKVTAKATTKKAAPKKVATKKTTVKKAVAKKAAPKKVIVKKVATKKATAKKTPAKKVAEAKKKIAAVKKSSNVKKMVPKAKAVNMNPKPANDTTSKTKEKLDFSSGDYVVYPAHGVGQVEGIETTTIGDMEVKLYAVSFEKDRMRLKIPVFKAKTSGLRKVAGGEHLDNALKTLKGRSRIKRMMWSRRAQEYEMKINSGDPVAIAEVLRDLKRSNDDTEQSYSERQIYQSALERLAREVAIVEKTSEEQASERIEKLMGKKKVANDAVAA